MIQKLQNQFSTKRIPAKNVKNITKKSSDEDLEFQLNFWLKVLKDAESTNHPILIQNTIKQINNLKEMKQIDDMSLVTTVHDFPN